MRVSIIILGVVLLVGAIQAQDRRNTYLADPALDPTVAAEAVDAEIPLHIRAAEAADRFKVASTAVPTGLPWPVSSPHISSVYLWFAPSEDAVSSITRCSSGQFPKHLAIDIAAVAGTAVKTVAAGTLKRYAKDPNWGWAAVIAHDNDSWSSVLWHLDPATVVFKEGAYVKAGDVVGKVKKLDAKLGDRDHVHLGIRAAKYDRDAAAVGYHCTNTFGFIDPLTVLKTPPFVVADDDMTLNGPGTTITAVGAWKTSSFVPLYHGRGYRVSDNASASFAYTVTVPADGTYDVYVRTSVDANRTSRAEYTITSGKMAPHRTTLDQRDFAHAGRWVWLAGFANFRGGGTVTVTARNAAGVGVLAADAILVAKR